MRISEERCADVLVLAVAGSLDAAGARQFAEQAAALLDAGAARVLLDLAHVVYVDHHGLDAVLAVAQRLRDHGRRLVIAAVQDNVFPVFEMNGFAGLMMLAPDRESGLALLAEPAGSQPRPLDVQAP